MDLQLNLENSGFRIFQLSSHTADQLHGHGDYYQFSIPLEGSPFLQHNQASRQVSTKERLLVSPADQHRHITTDAPARILLVGVKESYIAHVVADCLQKPAVQLEFAPWGEDGTDALRRLAEKAFLQSLQGALEKTQLEQLEWELANLMLSLQPGTYQEAWRSKRPMVSHGKLQQVLDYIQEEPSGELSLSELSAVAAVSKFHLIHLFRQHLGCTPLQYISEVRLRRAGDLLRETDLDILSIAYASGYRSLSSFQRAFKQKHGVSPGVYRRNI